MPSLSTTDVQKKNEKKVLPPSPTQKQIPSSAIIAAKTVPDGTKKSRIVTVKNAITPEMTKYRFWGSYYTPTKFYLTINKATVETNGSCSCPVDNNNIIEVTYHYEFKNGMVTGSKCIEFEIPENTTTVDITFSWNTNHRLMSSTGRAINSKNGTMKSSHKFL